MPWLRRVLGQGAQMLPPLPLLAIAALCTLPELALWLSADPAFLRGKLLQNFAFWPGILGRGWLSNYPFQGLVMFFTYGFLHAGLWHFLFNMATLFSLGAPLLAELRPARFVLLYAAGLAGGGLGYALLSGLPQPMVGASGALFALAGALVVQHFTQDWRELSLASALRAAAGPVALLVGMNVAMFYAMQGQLAWEAHLGGALAGAGAMLALTRQTAARDR